MCLKWYFVRLSSTAYHESSKLFWLIRTILNWVIQVVTAWQWIFPVDSILYILGWTDLWFAFFLWNLMYKMSADLDRTGYCISRIKVLPVPPSRLEGTKGWQPGKDDKCHLWLYLSFETQTPAFFTLFTIFRGKVFAVASSNGIFFSDKKKLWHPSFYQAIPFIVNLEDQNKFWYGTTWWE